MPSVRLYYTKADGRVVEVEQRPDEEYTEENATRADMAGMKTKVVDSDTIAAIPIDELEVHRGRPRRAGRRETAPQPGDRVAEIREMDRGELSDAEWLALFREYAESSGLMAARGP